MASQDRKSFDIVEKLYEQISREVEREYEERRNGFEALPMRDISEVDDAEELLYHMECSYDAESFEVSQLDGKGKEETKVSMNFTFYCRQH